MALEAQEKTRDCKLYTYDKHAVCLLGFALYIAWSSLTVPFERGLGVERFSSSLARFYLITFFVVATLLIAAVFVRSQRKHPWNRRWAVACGVLATLGVVFDLVAAAFPAIGAVLDVCSIVMRSITDAGFFIMWNWVISGQRAKVAWLGYAASMVLAACIYLVLAAVGLGGVIVGMLVLPALSCVLLAQAMHLKREGAPDDSGLAWSFPWRPVVLMALFSFSFCLAGHFDGMAQQLNEAGRLCVALVVATAILFAFNKVDIGLLYKLAPALMVAGLLLCAAGSAPTLSRLLVSFGYYSFTLFAFMVLSEICYRYGAPAEWLFGVTQAMCLIFTSPGSALGNALSGGAGLASLSAQASVQLVFGASIVALVLFAMLLMTARTPLSTWGVTASRHIAASADQSDTASPDGSQVPQDDAHAGESAGISGVGLVEDRIARCALIARAYGLTHREEEVLSLVAQGLTFQQIEANLYIAHGTLRVHVQHIYAKMDVHSHDEMRAAVENYRAAR